MRHKSRKAVATLILGALFLLGLSGVVLAAPPWSDAPNQFWVHTYGITEVQVATVAAGYADGTFRPDQPVTRAEFVKMAVMGLGIDTKNPFVPTFGDVAPGSAFYPWVEGGYAAGLVKGVASSAGLAFGPAAAITRQQTNSILARYLSSQEIEATGVVTGRSGGEETAREYSSLDAWYAEEGGTYLAPFADRAQISPAHAAGTAYLSFHEVIKGANGKLDPPAKLSRAQAAVMVLRVKGVTFSTTLPPVVSGVDPASGPVTGGTTVIIGGHRFLGAIAVMFGDSPASSFTIDGSGKIRAVAPAHAAGTVEVRVTTPRGTSALNQPHDAYVYSVQ